MIIKENFCRVCNSKIEPFMSFGQQPIANGFLTEDQIKKEYFFEMEVASCNNCGMFQLIEQPTAEKMFHENYAFFSSQSIYMQTHFKNFAEFVISKYFFKANKLNNKKFFYLVIPLIVKFASILALLADS